MLIFLLILLAVGAWAERWSLEHGLDGVVYALTPDRLTVDPGEPFRITTRIGNRKRMPVSFLKVQELLPRDITLSDESGLTVRRDEENARLTSTLYLSGRKTSERTLEATLPRRGRYFFRGCTLYGGDFLGLSQDVQYVTQNAEVVVYPARCESREVSSVLGGFLGDISVQRFILEDPVLTVGFREYTGREPFRSISWAQSARAGELMVKQYDYTAEPSVTVILNVEHQGELTHDMANRIEACYSIARTVCEELENSAIRYDFLTNATAAGALGVWSTVEEGIGARHLDTVLEGLGRATYDKTSSFDRLCARSMRRTDAGRGRIVITPELLPEHRAALDKLQTLRGGTIQVLTPPDPEQEVEA